MRGSITPARARALEVLVTHGRARQGVGMYDDRPADPTVSPAGASWLIDMGYAHDADGVLVPTDSGRQAHEAVD
jgi:hypothetical protein